MDPELEAKALEVQQRLSAELRRAEFLQLMDELNSSDHSCQSCSGHCCTYLYNSMQVSPLEALDVYFYLRDQNRIDQGLVDDLKYTVNKYRLSYEIHTGKNSEFRRSYTCPFFKEHSLGCSIAPEYKPYGCLAFNPKEAHVSEEGRCGTYLKEYLKRDSRNKEEDQINQELISTLSLYWSKRNLPCALLDIIKLFAPEAKFNI